MKFQIAKFRCIDDVDVPGKGLVRGLVLARLPGDGESDHVAEVDTDTQLLTVRHRTRPDLGGPLLVPLANVRFATAFAEPAVEEDPMWPDEPSANALAADAGKAPQLVATAAAAPKAKAKPGKLTVEADEP